MGKYLFNGVPHAGGRYGDPEARNPNGVELDFHRFILHLERMKYPPMDESISIRG